MIVQFELDMASRHLHQQVHGIEYAGRGIDIDGLSTPTEVHAADKPRQTKEMVAVEMGYTNVGYALHLLMVDAQLGLCVLATIHQYPEPIHIHHLSAAMAGDSGEGGSRTQYGSIEIQCVFNWRNRQWLPLWGRRGL